MQRKIGNILQKKKKNCYVHDLCSKYEEEAGNKWNAGIKQ
jgi:hypothetical protein